MPVTLPILALVIPVFNEEEAILECGQPLLKILSSLIQKQLIDLRSFIVFVDDGSTDQTWNHISQLSQNNSAILGLHIGKNSGQQAAILAGFFELSADIYISLDVDLQDDISKIEDMVTLYHEGKDIVYGVHSERSSDSLFKRLSARLYYKLMSILGMPTIPHHSEFRLVSRRVVKTIQQQYPERNLFLRTTILNLGFPSGIVQHKRFKRTAGKSKYNIFRLLRLVFDGLTAYSTRLLTFIIIGSVVFISIAILMFAFIGYSYFTGKSISGWASLIASLYFVGGCIMGSLAILAEYISRIYLETKRRPYYVITDTTPNFADKGK